MKRITKKSINDLNLKTGDIVLFNGPCLISKGIQFLTWCKWSHIGMVINDDRYDFPLLYESTHNDKLISLDINKKNKGVQIVPLYKRVRSYPGDVSIRRLMDTTITEENLYKLRLFTLEMQGKPFETNGFKMVMSNYKSPIFERKEDLSSIFCSELMAQAYMEMDLLGTYLPSNKYTPADFAKSDKLPLLRGKFGPVEYIRNFKKR